jgi:hypothetical protein
MNIGSLGIITGAAVQSTQARTSEVERVHQETSTHDREVESANLAEEAAGVGVTHEEEATGERDADGRTPWQLPDPPPTELATTSSEAIVEEAVPHHAKDPSGQSGTHLDVDG